MWEKARALLESCPAARALGEPCAEAEEAEGVWRILAELLEPSHVDVGFNLALSLERFDQYYDATQVWEAVIMANPDAHSRASKECSKVLSLIAREMGVPGAGSEHPDPDVEQRRQRERAEQGVSADPGNVGGGLGEAQSEMRHLQDDALAIQEEAKRLMLTDDCAGENGYHAVVACHSRAVALLGLLVFVVPNHGAAIGQLAEALALSGRPADATQLLNRVRKRVLFACHFIQKTRTFAKTGSGQYIGKVVKEDVSQVEVCAPLGVLGVDRLNAEGQVTHQACRGMFLNAGAVEQARLYREEVWCGQRSPFSIASSILNTINLPRQALDKRTVGLGNS